MWGLIENAKEVGMLEQMSLEQAYQQWKAGKLRTIYALHAANALQCECGNANGIDCFNSEHAKMRREMYPRIVQVCQCACVGCSEGNCCGDC